MPTPANRSRWVRWGVAEFMSVAIFKRLIPSAEEFCFPFLLRTPEAGVAFFNQPAATGTGAVFHPRGAHPVRQRDRWVTLYQVSHTPLLYADSV